LWCAVAYAVACILAVYVSAIVGIKPTKPWEIEVNRNRLFFKSLQFNKMSNASQLVIDNNCNIVVNSALPLHPDEETIKGVRYVQCERHEPHQRGSQKPSWVWQHGQTYAWPAEPDIVRAIRCHHCKEMIKVYKQQASNMQQHLFTTHKMVPQPQSRPSQGVSTPMTDSSMTTSTSVQRKQGQKQLYYSPKIHEWRQNLVRWCVEDHVAFAKVDTPGFKRLMLSTNPLIKPYLVSRMTVRRWIRRDYAFAKEVVKIKLKQALSKTHISFDIWTAPGCIYAFLGVVAHCVFSGEEGPRNQSILIALRRIEERHSGSNIAAILYDVLTEYNIVPRLGVFMADNAEANDVAIKITLSTLIPGFKDRDLPAYRARCIGHIINLACQAFLFGEDIEAFEFEIKGVDESTDFDSDKMRRAQRAWRKKGPLGKLHNIVLFVRSSSPRKEAFKKVTVGDKSVNSKFIFSCQRSCDKAKQRMFQNFYLF
jgi:hypothetical protein